MEELQICGGYKRRGEVFYERCCVAVQMRRNGFTYDRIAVLLCRTRATIIYYVKRYTEVIEDPRRDMAFAKFIKDFENRLNNIKEYKSC